MSAEAERAIVGALLKDNSVATEIDLAPDEFASADWAEAYKAITSMIAAGTIADMVTVSEALGSGHIDWVDVLARAERDCPSPRAAPHYAPHIREEHRRRRAIEIAEDLKLAVTDQGSDAVDSAIQQLMDLSAASQNHDYHIRQCLNAAVQEIERAESQNGPVGVTTGFLDLDKALGGWHLGDLHVIGARPAVGKTALLLNHAAACTEPCGVISSEQDMTQVGMRMLAAGAEANLSGLRNGSIKETEWPRISKAAAELHQRNIRINDEPGISLDQLHRQARKWVYRDGIKVLFIDYAQRIEGPKSRSRVDEVGAIIKRLKNIARELGIAVVSLAQVNRAVDSRTDKRPGMADLSDCSEIEKESDMVATLYREEVYEPDTTHAGEAELILRKNRHGPVGAIALQYTGQFVKFRDLAPPEHYEDAV